MPEHSFYYCLLNHICSSQVFHLQVRDVSWSQRGGLLDICQRASDETPWKFDTFYYFKTCGKFLLETCQTRLTLFMPGSFCYFCSKSMQLLEKILSRGIILRNHNIYHHIKGSQKRNSSVKRFCRYEFSKKKVGGQICPPPPRH